MNKKIVKLFILVISFLLLVPFSKASAQSSKNYNVTRLYGNDRYETCSQIANEGWKSSNYAVIISGEDFPDALSASTLAKKYNAPILLTESTILNSNAKYQIKRLGIKKVFIIGGNYIISNSVEKQINEMNVNTERIYGIDRYETSVKIANKIGVSNGIILTTGDDFSDAISISPISGKLQLPIILIPKDTIPESVKALINAKKISKTYILGDTDLINDSIANQFPNTQRINGNNKYERNINIINTFSNEFNFNNIYLAYSENFADAISVSALAALQNNAIILIGNTVPDITYNFIEDKLSSVNQIIVLGGNTIITDDELNTIFDPNNINFSINYKITLDDKVKDVDPNIIQATRQAIFDSDCAYAKSYNYNHSINNDILIFDVKQEGDNIWEVDFKTKKSEDKSYDTIGYEVVTVEKQKSGTYIGTTTTN